jgi:hypothetical protein
MRRLWHSNIWESAYEQYQRPSKRRRPSQYLGGKSQGIAAPESSVLSYRAGYQHACSFDCDRRNASEGPSCSNIGRHRNRAVVVRSFILPCYDSFNGLLYFIYHRTRLRYSVFVARHKGGVSLRKQGSRRSGAYISVSIYIRLFGTSTNFHCAPWRYIRNSCAFIFFKTYEWLHNININWRYDFAISRYAYNDLARFAGIRRHWEIKPQNMRCGWHGEAIVPPPYTNACNPVCARPRINAWMSWVPS